MLRSGAEIRSWQPRIAGVSEVLHARITSYSYPTHVHDEWTLLIVDEGAIRFDIDRREQAAITSTVTLLPPWVPHNGSAATEAGFRKRVVYLDDSLLPLRLTSSVATEPVIRDVALTGRVRQFHRAVAVEDHPLRAESSLALITAQLRERLGQPIDVLEGPGSLVARRLRDLLDSRFAAGLSLAEAAQILHVHPAHLVRTFSREFGISPHQYLTSRRVSASRRLLLGGMAPRDVGPAVGFYDQAHFTRRFRQIVGTTPAAFVRSGPRMHTIASPDSRHGGAITGAFAGNRRLNSWSTSVEPHTADQPRTM